MQVDIDSISFFKHLWRTLFPTYTQTYPNTTTDKHSHKDLLQLSSVMEQI